MAFTLSFSKKLSRNDMYTMLTTLSWMVSAGSSPKTGVDELLADPNNKMNKTGLLAIQRGYEEGKTFSEIFRENEAIFGTGCWQQLAAAERTGKLPEAMQRIAEQVKNDGDLMGKVRSAVTYPAVIMVFALAAGYYMFTSVVPDMAEMLIEFGVEMPALTVAVMNLSYFLIDNSLLVFGGLAGVIILVRWLLTKPFRFKWHRFIARMPYVGPISCNMNYSLVYTLINDMIENGANVTEALRVGAGSTTNIFIRAELENAAVYMERDGLGLTESLLKATTMPSDDKLMLQIATKTNREMEILPALSARRKEQAYASVNSLMEVMPSLVIIVVGAVVAVMVVAIYMPMISMATDIA